jgi:hypothetical protein
MMPGMAAVMVERLMVSNRVVFVKVGCGLLLDKPPLSGTGVSVSKLISATPKLNQRCMGTDHKRLAPVALLICHCGSHEAGRDLFALLQSSHYVCNR